MARNTVDYCMICGCLPCECTPKAAKKTAARKVTKPVIPPAPPTSEPQSPPRSRPNLSAIRSVKSADELEFERAITVLAAADILHHQHLTEYREVIDLPKWKIDAMIWKQRAKG